MKDNHPKDDGAKLSKTNFILWTVIAIIFCFLIVLFLLLLQNTKTDGDKYLVSGGSITLSFFLLLFSGIATSLLASLVFATLYTKVTEKRQLEVMGTELSAKLEEIYYKHIPSEIFPASNESNPDFVRAIEDGLINSNTYRIKTVRGNFLSKWLSEKLGAKQRPHLIMVLLLNPRKVDLFFPFIQGFSGRYDKNPEEIKSDIYKTVKNLFSQKEKTRIQIKIYEDTVFYRSEIFEDFALVSYYENHNHGSKFPTTYKYSRRNVNYAAVSADFEQTWSLNNLCFIEFNATTQEKELKEFLSKIGYENCTDAENPSQAQ